MAIVTVPQFAIPPIWHIWPITGTTGIGPINASGDRVAMVIECPKAGTLHSFEFQTSTVGNNPDNGLRLSFQDVDLTNGNPDGTQDQFCDITGTISANTWQVPGHALTNDGTSGGTKRTVAVNELVACVIDFVSFVASDSVTFVGLSSSIGGWRNFYLDDGSAGSYSKNTTTILPIALKYDDGTYAEFFAPVYPVNTVTGTTYNTGSAADERALRFQVPIPMRLIGCWVGFDFDGNTDMVLYDNASSVLASASIDLDVRCAASAGIHVVYFDSKISLSANTTYRLSAKPTSVTSLTSYEWNVNSNGLLAAIPGGIEWYASSRVDAGAWSDVTTRRPQMGLIFDGVDTYYSSVGGGGHSAYWG